MTGAAVKKVGAFDIGIFFLASLIFQINAINKLLFNATQTLVNITPFIKILLIENLFSFSISYEVVLDQ